MKIFVDCKEIKIPVDKVVSLVELINRASLEVQRELKEEAFDVQGSPINSLNEFIMNTNKDRQLHLETPPCTILYHTFISFGGGLKTATYHIKVF